MKINKIDTERYYNTHIEILKECFNIEKKTHRRGMHKLSNGEAVWFPKLNDPRWENKVVDDCIWERLNDEDTRDHTTRNYKYTRYTFLKDDVGYRWVGVYVFDAAASTIEYNVYRRIL